MRQLVFLMILAGTLVGSVDISAQTSPTPIYPSVVQLLANPEKYDGKIVSVVGFLCIQHEGDTLYLHREDYQNALLENGLWVDTTEEMGRNKSTLNLKYVIIVATFRARPDGMQDHLVGGLTKIQSARVWSDPEHPVRARMP